MQAKAQGWEGSARGPPKTVNVWVAMYDRVSDVRTVDTAEIRKISSHRPGEESPPIVLEKNRLEFVCTFVDVSFQQIPI